MSAGTDGRELAVATLIDGALAPTLIGRDPIASEDIWKFGRPIGAAAQIEMAAITSPSTWPCGTSKAKWPGCPFTSFWARPTRRKLLTYAHTGGRDFAECVDTMLAAKARGFKVIRSQVQIMPGSYGAEDKNDPDYARS